MTIRELTDRQRKMLTRRMDAERVSRNKGRPEKDPLDKLAYNTGFSDGVRIILNQIDKLP